MGGDKCDVTLTVPQVGNQSFSVYGYSSDCCKAIQKAAETGEEPEDPPAECASVDSVCMIMTFPLPSIPSIPSSLKSDNICEHFPEWCRSDSHDICEHFPEWCR